MELYKEIKFKNLDWIYLGEENGKVKLLLKNVLDEERIKKYSNDDFMIDGPCVIHQDHLREFDWNKSYIKNQILPEFKKDLGIECGIDLLSRGEVDELPEKVRECNDWYWTKTRVSILTSSAFVVYEAGLVNTSSVYSNNYAVRPVLYLESAQFLNEKIGNKSYSEKIEELEDLTLKISEIIKSLKEEETN